MVMVTRCMVVALVSPHHCSPDGAQRNPGLRCQFEERRCAAPPNYKLSTKQARPDECPSGPALIDAGWMGAHAPIATTRPEGGNASVGQVAHLYGVEMEAEAVQLPMSRVGHYGLSGYWSLPLGRRFTAGAPQFGRGAWQS
jgi:hypothetical protein